MPFILFVFGELKIPEYELWLEVRSETGRLSYCTADPRLHMLLSRATAFNLLFKSYLPASYPLILEIRYFQVFMFHFEEIRLPLISKLYSWIDLKSDIMF